MSETNKQVPAVIRLSGRIDSNNASEVEKDAMGLLTGSGASEVIIDAGDLEYISSAGLRVILRIRQMVKDVRITGVRPEVYEVLDMTGFTEMMSVEKAYRLVSVEGCEEIGRGANGTVYRIDQDNVVKVYNNPDALAEIQHEREVARLALILGLPTAISYDVVRVGAGYGSVFELLNATSFSKILANEPEKMDWVVREYVKLLKLIHGTVVPEGKLPDIKETVENWVDFLKDHLPEASWNKLKALVDAVPHDDHMIHGDYHTKNVVLQGDEVLIIDMDTLAVGHPIFEFASIYNSFQGYSEYDHSIIKDFQGFDYETATEFWYKVLAEYLGTQSKTKIHELEDKSRIVGYARMIRRSIRRHGLETEKGRAEIELWRSRLIELLERVDTLLFDPNELEIEALSSNLPEVQAFVEEKLEAAGFPMKEQMQIGVAVEEIFINVASYAYAPETGKAKLRVEISDSPTEVTVTFSDSGVPYDPLAKEDPDVTLSADEREIGGLGIFMTKKLMDDMSYEYKDGKNILTLKKKA